MERMKQLTVCIDDGLQGEVVYRAEISHTEEEYKELENELEYVRIIKDSAEEILKEVREENKKLNEFKTKREESMFYFKALAERVEPINSKEAEELQKYKKLFEKLYREELQYLEEGNKTLNEKYDGLWKIYTADVNERIEENKELKERIRFLEQCLDNKEKVNKSMREEIKELRGTQYIYGEPVVSSGPCL